MSKFYDVVKNRAKLLAFSGLVAVVATGCAPKLPALQETQLDDGAKGIALVNKGERAIGCALNGDLTVKETTRGKYAGTLATMEESALNKIKNEAAASVAPGTKIMLRITDTKVVCHGGYSIWGTRKADFDCDPSQVSPDAGVVSYQLKAEVLGCGQK